MSLEHYMGQKGYSIYKDKLTVKEQEKIRQDLNVSPAVKNMGYAKLPSFYVYRESPKKFYVPRFYGLQHFGIPKVNQIRDGIDIDTEFNGSLREKQIPVVEKYLKHIEKHNCGLLDLYCGFGKTCLGLYIISKIKKKTLIIVHKEFLLNQWIERIEEFLPTARIGKIQGQIIDVDDKDIVIGMLQSISMKEYPISLFQQFGFTIIDECHHISAETFSNALFKVVTKHMLGLSATMTRKDGLTKVFKMFLGDVVVKKKREGTDDVEVRAITYQSDDAEFNKVVTNFKGQTQYSNMLKKLCEFQPRREFIISIIKKVIQESVEKGIERHIMVIAHNKSILTYIHNSIRDMNIATVGYYVGGMKEKDLKITETKKIIIATYAMAEEALDIKTLNTLIMTTPKTDVTQTVGRILRITGNNPLVVDIVDNHHTFKNQWKKRRAFYNKCKYNIKYMVNDMINDTTNNSVRNNTNDEDNSIFLQNKCLL
jgi:superfamily II DNA or RNA helicase